MEFRFLGTLEAVEDGRPVPLGPPQQRAVLALLLLHANAPLSTDRLVDELWDGRPPASAPKIVQNYVWHLRQALGEDAISTRGGAYVLHVEPGQTDATRFDVLLEAGRRALADDDASKALDLLQQALDLWRGPPFGDLMPLRALDVEIGKLEERRLAAVEERFEACLRLGRHEDVIADAGAILAANPLRERLRGQLMLALYRAGRQAEALQTYRDLRRTLAEDLGLEPSGELQGLEAAILRRDPELALEPQPRTMGRTRRRRRPFVVALGCIAAFTAAVLVGIAASDDPDTDARETTIAGGTTTRPSAGSGPGLATSSRVAVEANSAVAIDPRSLRVVASVPVGATPGDMAFAHGSLWVLNSEDTTVSRVDPVARVAVRTIAVSERPSALAADAQSVWILSRRGVRAPRILRIDPSLNTVVETRPAPGLLTHGSGRRTLATGAGGLWLTDPTGLPRIYWIDPNGRRRHRETAIGSNAYCADGVAVVVGGGVWTATCRSVSLVDPTSGTILRQVAVSQTGGPTGLTSFAGSLWLLSRPGFRCCPIAQSGVGTLTQIDMRTGQVIGTTTIPGVPIAATAGLGSVWVANQAGTVFRVDPDTARIQRRVQIGKSAGGLAVGGGAVWVSARE